MAVFLCMVQCASGAVDLLPDSYAPQSDGQMLCEFLRLDSERHLRTANAQFRKELVDMPTDFSGLNP